MRTAKSVYLRSKDEQCELVLLLTNNNEMDVGDSDQSEAQPKNRMTERRIPL